MKDLAWLGAHGTELEIRGVNCGYPAAWWMRHCRKLRNGYGLVFLSARARWVANTGYTILIRFADYNHTLDNGRKGNAFFIRQIRSLTTRWKRLSSSDRGSSRKIVLHLLTVRRGSGVQSETWETSALTGKDSKKKGENHIPVQLSHCIHIREEQSLDSQVQCSTGLVIERAGIFDVLRCLHNQSGVQVNVRKVLHTGCRGLICAMQS